MNRGVARKDVSQVMSPLPFRSQRLAYGSFLHGCKSVIEISEYHGVRCYTVPVHR
jgi:hypothetical protein